MPATFPHFLLTLFPSRVGSRRSVIVAARSLLPLCPELVPGWLLNPGRDGSGGGGDRDWGGVADGWTRVDMWAVGCRRLVRVSVANGSWWRTAFLCRAAAPDTLRLTVSAATRIGMASFIDAAFPLGTCLTKMNGLRSLRGREQSGYQTSARWRRRFWKYLYLRRTKCHT